MTKRERATPAIYCWWLGLGPSPDGLLEAVRGHVEHVFGLGAVLWDAPARPSHAFDPRRGQHSSTRLLEWLLERGPSEARKLLGITDVDLFIPILTFVFGEAQLAGRASIVSTARLAPDGVARDGDRLLTARLAKEAAHEVGHSFGLVHCDDRRCVMSRSASLIDVDVKGGGLCHDCWTRYLDLRDQPGGCDE